jgi:hypothetical protein
MKRETWRTVEGAEAAVSDRGRLRCLRTGRLLKHQENPGGYMRVRVWAGARKAWRKVHLLVLEAFVGPRPSERHHGAHAPRNDKRCNRLDNLRWATREENERDKKEVGTARRGMQRRLMPLEVAAIVTSLHSATRTARLHRIHRSSVARLRRRHANL